MLNHYEILKELGRGCHGKVKLGRDTRTQELVAIKIVQKNTRRRLGSRSIISTQLAKVHKEIAILKKCDHPNVVGLKEVIDDPTSKKIYMVLEYMDGGEVHFHEKDSDIPILDKDTIRHVMRGVISGLQYLHNQGIIHRDIKPANLLWSSDGTIKISDFGVSFCRRQPSLTFSLASERPSSTTSSMEESSVLSASPLSELQHFPSMNLMNRNSIDEDELELAKTAGSPAFFAPELCWSGEENCPRPRITSAIDIWALGITLYCMAYGKPPFMAESEYELFEIIPVKPLEFPKDIPSDPELEDLIIKLLEKDPSKRLSLEQAKLHPWIIKDLDDVEQYTKDGDPSQYPNIEVTEEEVKRAVTLKDRIRKHLRKLSESFIKVFHK
ncbi:kinase-like protein [Neoconidiobolus thromboides FSU 785]|nr:kinase-like protein [Neoconidiobolus thromboides FSU 785]